jgi:hypothetical protein
MSISALSAAALMRRIAHFKRKPRGSPGEAKAPISHITLPAWSALPQKQAKRLMQMRQDFLPIPIDYLLLDYVSSCRRAEHSRQLSTLNQHI